MPETRLNPGAQSFDAANWEDATGFADNAELAVVGSREEIADGNKGTLTTGINYIDFRGGEPKVGRDAAGPLQIKPATAYTTRPNLRWATNGGELLAEVLTNAANRVELTARAGMVTLIGGDLKETFVAGAQLVNIGTGVDLSVALYVFGSATVIIDEHSTPATDIPAIVVGENANVIVRRPFAAATILGRGVLAVDNRSGTDSGGVAGYGGSLAPISGVIDGFEFYGGDGIDDSRLEALASVGVADGIQLWAPGLRLPPASELLTLGTVTSKFTKIGSAGPA